MLLSDAVERKVDDDLQTGRMAAETCHAFDDPLPEQAVCRNGDDPGTAAVVTRDDDVDEIGSNERLTAAERRPVEGWSDGVEKPLVLGEREVVDALLPDVARAALR